MASGSGSKSGTTGKRSSAGQRTTRKTGPRKRTTSKPVIIDVDADAVSKSEMTEPPKTSSAESAKSGGLDDQTAQAAGLSARPTAKATSDTSAPKAKSTEPEKPASPTMQPDDPADPVVPPGARDAGGGPSPFYLFAAGLIGALLALVLMFLATLAGLFSLSDGRVDGQAVALLALEERVQAIEAREPVAASDADASLLDPLEAELAALRGELETLRAGSGDGAPLDVDAAVSSVLDPLEARVAVVETELQSALDALAALDQQETPSAVAETADPALADGLDDLASDFAALRSEVTDLQSTVSGLQSAMADLSPQISDRLDGLDGLATETGAQISALNERVSGLLSDVETLGLQTSALGDDLTALAEAPVTQAPDRLARLGVALDALVAARDSGADVAPPLAAAQGAASFDGQLADALAPLSSAQVSGALSDAAILAMYEDVYDAMRAAVPGSESDGLLGALEERARQMVTIRAPEGAALSGGDSPSARLDRLGSLIAAGRFEDALALSTGLPVAMQQASGSLVETLNARAALDDAIANARQALMVQLSVPVSEVNSQ